MLSLDALDSNRVLAIREGRPGYIPDLSDSRAQQFSQSQQFCCRACSSPCGTSHQDAKKNRLSNVLQLLIKGGYSKRDRRSSAVFALGALHYIFDLT